MGRPKKETEEVTESLPEAQEEIVVATPSDKEIEEYRAWKAQKAAKVEVIEGNEEKMRRMWKEESRMVKGIYRCHEPQGGSVAFSFRKYKWDPVQQYVMVDGEVYEIPLAVARHLNNNCNYEVHSNVLDADGKPTLNKNKKKSRMNFESVEFSVV